MSSRLRDLPGMPMLELYTRSFADLDARGIDCAAWKGLDELPAALLGDGDIDLYVRPSARACFLDVLPRRAANSPGPSGVLFEPDADRLIAADSEINETPLFAGANLFVTDRDGVQESLLGRARCAC